MNNEEGQEMGGRTAKTGGKTTEPGGGYWKIDRRLVEHVAKVARLKLTEQELDKFSKQLEEVLKAFKEIDKVDTAGAQPSFHPQPLSNDWREDGANPFEWGPDGPLANTEHKEGKYFKGPKIV